MAKQALETLDNHLRERPFVVGETPSIADISLFAYTHVAPDAGLRLDHWPAGERWIGSIEVLPGFLNDFAPYPDNARAGLSRSIYD
jgi:glutathione S-transferase